MSTINIDNTDSEEAPNARAPALEETLPLNQTTAVDQRVNVNEAEGEENLPFPDFVPRVFYCLNQRSFPRYQCLRLIMWPWFERLTLLMILLNCITLGMYEPCCSSSIETTKSAQSCQRSKSIWLERIDHFIFIYFTVEMSIRMVAMGIFGKKTYLAESWNRLDCFIVLSGLLEMIIPGDNLSLSSIRTVRVLRPLRAINGIPSMRILVMLLLDTLPMLVNVLLLYFFIFFIFGIIAVQLWKGLLRNRCFLQVNQTLLEQFQSVEGNLALSSYYIPPDSDSFICSNSLTNGMAKCSDIPRLKQDHVSCYANLSSFSPSFNQCIDWNQYYQQCLPSEHNPFSGSINFDNIAYAWLAIFQSITLEGWTTIMYYLQDAHSFWNWVYFVCLTIIGSFFMTNICLAVISAQFSITKKRETEKILLEQSRLAHSSSSLAISNQDSCWEALIKQIQRFFRHLSRRIHNRCKKNQKTKSRINEKTPPIGSLNGKHLKTCRYSRQEMFSESFDSGTGHSEFSLNNEITPLPTVVEHDQRCDCSKTEKPIVTPRKSQSKPQKRVSTIMLSRISIRVRHFVHSRIFDSIILAAISVNTFTMSIEYHGQPQWLTDILEYTNYIFIALFTAEMLFKLIADGFLQYIRNAFNVFDGIIVIISLVELFQSNSSGLVVLRTFRLLRILKLIRFLPTLRQQFSVMVKTLDSVATFCLLLLLFVFIFSVLGMHLFGGEFSSLTAWNTSSNEKVELSCRCCICPERAFFTNSTELKDSTCIENRANFDSLRWALITVFQVMTQEDWNEVLYAGMEKKGPWSALYFVALMIFGNYILLNLLVAILVEGFINEKNDRDSCLSALIPIQLNSIEAGRFDLPRRESARRYSDASVSSSALTKYFSVQERRSIDDDDRPSRGRFSRKNSRLRRSNAFDMVSHSFSQAPTVSSYRTARDTLDTHSTGQNLMFTNQFHQIEEDERPNPASPSCQTKLIQWFNDHDEYSLYIFSPSNKFRRLFRWLIDQSWFDSIILFFIVLSCVTMAVERPSIPPQSLERQFLNATNTLFTIVFLVEMLIKVVSLGLLIGDETYLHNGWNILDGFLVLTSLIDLSINNRSLLKVFRLLRTLKPLRMIRRAPGLKLVVETLLSSVQPLGHVMVICCVFFLIFAILGVQLFKGQFYYCEGALSSTVNTRQECEQLPEHQWLNQQYNFDHLGQALLTLFVLSSKDGWVQLMYNGIDSRGIDLQPIRGSNEGKSIYFVSFIVLVSFFILNMFVGIIVENFHSCREKLERELRMERERKIQLELERQAAEGDGEAKEATKREVPFYLFYSAWRRSLYLLTTKKSFDIFITSVIGLNVLVMSIEFYQMPSTLEKFLEWSNYVFTGFFLLEFLIKIVALGPIRYFKDKWNQFDFVVVVLSVVGLVIDQFNEDHLLPINPTIIRVMRLLRIARILRLLKMAKGIQALLDTILQALPQVANLSLLFLLIFFIYATLGVELFARISCSEDHPCVGLGRHAHFHHVGIALLTLFRVATGDNWNAILKDTLKHQSSSFVRLISPLYFISFVLITQFVLVNLVVAVLLKKLEDSNRTIADDEQTTSSVNGTFRRTSAER